MGYTNYWQFKNIRGQRRKTDKAYLEAIRHCNGVIALYQSKASSDYRLSGYSAHAPYKYEGIKINGKGDQSCEDFVLRATLTEALCEKFNFCKTREYPYDIAVKACLIVLKMFLGDAFSWDCDSRHPDIDSNTSQCLVNEYFNKEEKIA